MIFYIVMAIAVLVMAVSAAAIYDPPYDGGGWALAVGSMCTLVWLLVAIPLTIPTSMYIGDNKTHIDHTHTDEIQQIDMGDKITGRSYFLTGGYIDQQLVYNYYYKTEIGYRVGHAIAEYTDIIESDTETPRVEEHHWFADWWITPRWTGWLGDAGSSWTIYVPKGSVKQTIDMSLPE